MKNETKIKIIKFVRWLLRYNDGGPPFIIEERKIQKIRSEHILTQGEAEFCTQKLIEEQTAINLLKVMLHIGAIKFEWKTTEDNHKKVTATTFVPEKL